jgi:hypothetical protein
MSQVITNSTYNPFAGPNEVVGLRYDCRKYNIHIVITDIVGIYCHVRGVSMINNNAFWI